MLDVLQIGAQIKKFRKSRGLTQQSFADELHVSFQAVSNWERGIAPPDLENIIRIAAFFGVLVDDLLLPKDEELILGIDGGGTKTAFAVVTLDGHILEYFVYGESNPNDIGAQNTLNIISGGITEALKKYSSISTVFCGIAGVTSGGQIEYLTQELRRKYPNKKIVVNSDYENIFAMDEASQIAIISGTGSVVCVRTENGYARFGGWGYLFDKAGSAYDIGREAIFTALQEETFGKSYSLISKLLQKELKVPIIRDALGSIYNGGKPYIASFSRIVFEAYENGDVTAINIIDDNAKRLAELLNCAVDTYGVPPRAISGGGMFEHYGEIMLRHMSKYTDVEIIAPKCPPIYGACRQSRKLIDNNVPLEFCQNFIKSYMGVEK